MRIASSVKSHLRLLVQWLPERGSQPPQAGQPRIQVIVSHSNVRPFVGDLWDKYSYNPSTGTLHRRDNDRPLLGNRCNRSHQLSIHGSSRHPYGVVVFAWINGRWPIQGMEIDHIDRDPFNQRWHNLREVTRRQNMQNTRRSNGGTTRRGSRWIASIWVDRKAHKLGSFATQKEAQTAYLAACASRGLAYLPELVRGL